MNTHVFTLREHSRIGVCVGVCVLIACSPLVNTVHFTYSILM